MTDFIRRDFFSRLLKSALNECIALFAYAIFQRRNDTAISNEQDNYPRMCEVSTADHFPGFFTPASFA